MALQTQTFSSTPLFAGKKIEFTADTYLHVLAQMRPLPIPSVFVPPPVAASLCTASRALPQTVDAKVVERIREVILGGGAQGVKVQAPLTDGATSAEDVAADISWLFRTFFYCWDNSPVYQAMGLTTAFNSVMGGIAASKSFGRHAEAVEIGDNLGITESRVDFLRGLIQAGGGVSYIGVRGLTIACEVMGVNRTISATTALGKATFGITFGGDILWALFYGIIGIWGAVQTWCKGGLADFSRNLDAGRNPKALDDPKNLKDYLWFLQDYSLEATSKEALSELMDEFKSCAPEDRVLKIQEKLSLQALKRMTAFIQTTFKEWKKETGATGKDLSKKDCEEIAKAFFAQANQSGKDSPLAMAAQSGIAPARDADLFELVKKLSFQSFFGLQVTLDNLRQRKEVQLARVTSDDCVTALKKAKDQHLQERLDAADPVVQKCAVDEAKALVQKVKSELSKNTWLMRSFMASGALGCIATILGFFFLTGPGALVVTVLTLACIVVMIGFDSYFLYNGLKSAQQGTMNVKFIILSMAVCLIGVAISIALFVLVPHLSLPAFIIGLLIAVGWLGVDGYALYKVHQRNKEYPELFPTLRTFLKFTESQKDGKLTKKTAEVMRRLPKQQRQEIKKALCEKHQRVRGARELFIPGDSDLNRDHRFGENFFRLNPRHEDVILAIEKALREKWSLKLQGLRDRLKDVNISDNELRKYFNEQLVSEEKELVCQLIWRRRAKDFAGRYLRQVDADVSDLEWATQKVLQKTQDDAKARLAGLASDFRAFAVQISA